MQAAHLDAGVGAGPANFSALGRRHAPAVVAEGERSDFEAAITELGRQRALPVEGKLADHFVAERELHRRASS